MASPSPLKLCSAGELLGILDDRETCFSMEKKASNPQIRGLADTFQAGPPSGVVILLPINFAAVFIMSVIST